MFAFTKAIYTLLQNNVTATPNVYAHTGDPPFIGNIDALWYFLIIGITVFCLFYVAKKIRSR